MSQELPEWANTLLTSLEIEPVDVKLTELQGIAQALDAHPDRDAILVGFIAGYAAGLAEGSEMAIFDRAHAASVRFMERHLSRE